MRRCLLPTTFLLAAVDAQQWTALDGPQYLDRAVAFDTHRLRLVMFSGDGETWEYDGDQLLHRPRLTGAAAPPPRSRAQMAYDPLRKHVLMFGGDVNNSSLADTWTFDGARWTQLVSQPSPPQRAHGAITFDSVRGRVLLHGGTNLVAGFHTDTWEHDGAQWIQRAPATVPSSSNPVMAFDSGRGVAVMVTYPVGLPGQPNGTWEWNGTDWLQRTPFGAVPAVDGHRALAYDPVRQRTVMTGGQTGGDQVWEWDGTAWALRATVSEPHRNFAASWFDPVSFKVVVAGGQNVVVNATCERTDAYEWDGVAMTTRRSEHRPPSRQRHAWFTDPSQQPMLFGGQLQTALADTWRWNGNTWTQLSPTNQPPGRGFAATTFDWMRGEPLLFGGIANPSTVFGDLWAWTGTDWAPRSSAGPSPSARSEASFCFDLVRGVAVLFGGSTSTTPLPGFTLNDTWEWNGAAWTNRPTLVQPSPRAGAAMTFDIMRGRVVLFGGSPMFPLGLSDTWEWDGTQWLAIQPPVAPPILLQPSLNYDLVRGHSVLSGTRSVGQTPQPAWDLWRYDGVTWTPIATSVAASAMGPARLDMAHDRLLATSGLVLSEWSLRASSVAEYGSGCGTPAPVLLARARPRLGEPAFGVEIVAGAGQLVGFAFAETQANVPLGNGCSLLFGQPATSVFGIAGGNGVASVSMALPDYALLHGYVLFVQAGVLDPASPGGFKLTQGLRFAFGD